MVQTGAPESGESDEALAQRARHGARDALEILVSRYQSCVYRLAFRMSRNASDAEEVTQDTFLILKRAIASFHAESRFGTWLHRIAINAVLMRKRAATRRPTCSLDALQAAGGAADAVGSRAVAAGDGELLADELLDQKRRAERVHGALERLDDDARAAVVLRDLEEMSAGEAAEVLGISPDAVRQRAHRARLRLRELLYS